MFLSPISWHRWEAWSHLPSSPRGPQQQLCLLVGRRCTGLLSPAGQGRADNNHSLPCFLMVSVLPFHQAGQSAFLVNVLPCSEGQTSNTHRLLSGCAATLPSEGPLQLCHPGLAKPKWLHSWKKNFLEVFPLWLFWQIFLLHSQNGKSYRCHNCFRDTVCTLVLWNRCTILLQGLHIHAIFSLIIFKSSFKRSNPCPP